MEWQQVGLGIKVQCTKDGSRTGSGEVTKLHPDRQRFDMSQECDGATANVLNCNPEDFDPA
ncbi:hypothetical protein KKF61_05405 [Patescibacteria group bacterium]|nr:hypothetical protein [Patescibacteria group bacterium]MBU0964410.1 hypothetical protein [Patescibacteria group bacterium]